MAFVILVREDAMPGEGSVTNWIDQLRAGDQAAEEKLWQRYFEGLLRVARGRIGGQSRRVADEEDLALSAMNSFFEAVRRDRCPRLHDRDDLWQLLVLITARKAIDQFHAQRRQKRGGGASPIQDEHALERIVGREPTPEFALLVAEECRRLLDRLGDASLARLAQLKLACYTNEEIAKDLNCSLRTVERKLELIRAKWSEGRPDDE